MDVLTSSFGVLSLSYVETIGIAVLVCVLGFTGAPLWLWTALSAAGLWTFGAPGGLWWGFGAVALLLNARPLRRNLISSRILKVLKALRLLPVISPTEQAAIEAGSVWIDADLFSGKPDFRRLNAEPYPDLNERERAFLSGPVEAACRLADDWRIHRDALTSDIFLPGSPDEALGRLETAFELSCRAEPVSGIIRKAARAGLLSGRDPDRLVEQAIEKELITPQDAELFRRAETARDQAVRVDAFTPEEYLP